MADPGEVNRTSPASKTITGQSTTSPIIDRMTSRHRFTAGSLDFGHDLLSGADVGATAGRRPTEIVHHDLGAQAPGLQRDPPTDTAGGAGYDDDLSIKQRHWIFRHRLSVS